MLPFLYTMEGQGLIIFEVTMNCLILTFKIVFVSLIHKIKGLHILWQLIRRNLISLVFLAILQASYHYRSAFCL